VRHASWWSISATTHDRGARPPAWPAAQFPRTHAHGITRPSSWNQACSSPCGRTHARGVDPDADPCSCPWAMYSGGGEGMSASAAGSTLPASGNGATVRKLARAGIVIDASCDVSPAFLADPDVAVIPIPIRIGKSTYVDQHDPEATARYMQEN